MKTSPLPRETIVCLDRLLALQLLVADLSQIPEFFRLWDRARGVLDLGFEVILPAIRERIVAPLSPQVRAAMAGSQGSLSTLSEERDRKEAEEALSSIESFVQAVFQAVSKRGIQISYSEEIAALVEPLGVPDMAFTLLMWDVHWWGLDKLLATESKDVEGPVTDYLKAWLMKHLTDLDAAELAMESPGQIRRRMKVKVSPLTRNYRRGGLNPFHFLQQRIHLWVLNKVYGHTIPTIAEEEGFTEEWVSEQIKEATRILAAKVPTGRPRKGGVLRHWQTML